MADSTIRNLPEKITLGANDLLLSWDSSEATSKKCKVSALDSQLFSKAQKPPTTSATGKDVVVISYDANNNASPQRIPFETLKSEVYSSLPGVNLIGGSVSNDALAGNISPDKLQLIPASKLENTLNFSGKAVTLPSDITIPDNSVKEASINTGAVTTEKIRDGSVTDSKLAGTTAPRLATAWGVLKCDLMPGKAVEYTTGANMAFTKTSGYQNRVTVVFTGVSHSLKVGDWVSFANTARIPATDTTFDTFAWSPTGAGTLQATHTANLWVNDVIRGAQVNATQLTPGQRYIIKSVGTTNWTPAGANFNRDGDVFIANSTVLTGTGVAESVVSYTVGIWPVVSVNGVAAFDFETLQTVPNGVLNDFVIRPVRVMRGYNIAKVGRIVAGRFRIYWSTAMSDPVYPVIPTAQTLSDVVVSAGTVVTTPTYVDITCGATIPDEMRLVAFA